MSLEKLQEAKLFYESLVDKIICCFQRILNIAVHMAKEYIRAGQ